MTTTLQPHQKEVLRRLLRKRGSFTEQEFDVWFSGREQRRPIMTPKLDGDGPAFGLCLRGPSVYTVALHTLIHMAQCGIVYVRSHPEGSIYTLA